VVVLINIITVPYILILVVPMVAFFLWFRSYYMNTAREIKRLEASCKYTIYHKVLIIQYIMIS